jgi:hypothetical protein
MDLHKPNNKLVSANLNTFDARTSHEQIQIHKTHHGSDLGEVTTFLFIVYSVASHGTKWHFVLGLPSGSPQIPKLGIPVTLGGP